MAIQQASALSVRDSAAVISCGVASVHGMYGNAPKLGWLVHRGIFCVGFGCC